MDPMKPTVGRIVIFTSPGNGNVEMAAIVIGVNADGTCNLAVLVDFPAVSVSVPGGHVSTDTEGHPVVLRRRMVAEGTGPDTWHWPTRV